MNSKISLKKTSNLLTNNLERIMLPGVLFLMIAMLLSCDHHPKTEKTITSQQLKEPLIRANIAASQAEEQDINDFVERYGWDMITTGTGLRYRIYSHGSGPKSETGKIATLTYTVRLLTGDIIYTSGESGPKEFLIGKGGVESGLEEAILYLRVGDKAKIIIPSHLGFGLAGDDHKIPPKATLIYDVELLAIN